MRYVAIDGVYEKPKCCCDCGLCQSYQYEDYESILDYRFFCGQFGLKDGEIIDIEDLPVWCPLIIVEGEEAEDD